MDGSLMKWEYCDCNFLIFAIFECDCNFLIFVIFESIIFREVPPMQILENMEFPRVDFSIPFGCSGRARNVSCIERTKSF